MNTGDIYFGKFEKSIFTGKLKEVEIVEIKKSWAWNHIALTTGKYISENKEVVSVVRYKEINQTISRSSPEHQFLEDFISLKDLREEKLENILR